MIPFDRYTIRARIEPALWAVIPFGVLLFIWMAVDSIPVGALWGAVGTCGGTALLSQIGRDQGRKKQAALWKSWGGPPTTRLLRYRDPPNKEILSRWRTKLEKLMGYTLPNELEESENPTGADQKYEAAVSFLLEATRDTSRFPLVFAENVNYGFRRNLWGLKPFGLGVALLATTLSWVLLFSSADLSTMEVWLDNVINDPNRAVIARLSGSMLNTVIVAVWLFVIKPQWVKTTAEAYAQRLLGAIDTLHTHPVAEMP